MTCQSISSALKSQTLLNLPCSKLVYLQVKFSQPFLTGKTNYLVLLTVIKMTVKTSQNSQLINFDLATKVQL